MEGGRGGGEEKERERVKGEGGRKEWRRFRIDLEQRNTRRKGGRKTEREKADTTAINLHVYLI